MSALVRQFIVQERPHDAMYKEGGWLDDPEQPDDCACSLEKAKRWLENDNKTFCGHGTTYEHRIIERTETQVWSNIDGEEK